MPAYLSAIAALALIGVLNTTYLAYHSITGTPVRCLFFPNAWCEKVQFSKYSRTFGIPNSFAGFFMYSALLVLTLLFAQGQVPFWPIQAIIGLGFAFSLYFLFIQAFVLRAFCTWCVLSFFEFTALLAILLTR